MRPIRTQKVYYKLRTRTYDHIAIPEIKLEGIRLKKLGFEIGKGITIKTAKNKLIITVSDKDQ